MNLCICVNRKTTANPVSLTQLPRLVNTHLPTVGNAEFRVYYLLFVTIHKYTGTIYFLFGTLLFAFLLTDQPPFGVELLPTDVYSSLQRGGMLAWFAEAARKHSSPWFPITFSDTPKTEGGWSFISWVNSLCKGRGGEHPAFIAFPKPCDPHRVFQTIDCPVALNGMSPSQHILRHGLPDFSGFPIESKRMVLKVGGELSSEFFNSLQFLADIGATRADHPGGTLITAAALTAVRLTVSALASDAFMGNFFQANIWLVPTLSPFINMTRPAKAQTLKQTTLKMAKNKIPPTLKLKAFQKIKTKTTLPPDEMHDYQ